MFKLVRIFVFVVAALTFTAALAVGQDMGAGRNVGDMKFTTIPPLPTCTTGTVQSGDPSKEASIIYAKVAAGCVIPWHWHTPTEHLMIVSGTAKIEMKDGKPMTLKAGGFAKLPGKHVHQFTCEQACQFYIYSDLAFDMHYVNAKGTEITPADALKAVKETVATEMK